MNVPGPNGPKALSTVPTDQEAEAGRAATANVPRYRVQQLSAVKDHHFGAVAAQYTHSRPSLRRPKDWNLAHGRGGDASRLVAAHFIRVSPFSLPAWDLFADETEIEAGRVRSGAALERGALNAAVANEVGKLIADYTGRGAQKSRAFVYQDLVVCVLEDGANSAEKNLAAAGKADLVRLQRDAVQRLMGPQLIEAVERLTARRVRTFLSGCDETGAASVEAFVLEPERD
jgi:uncharacterized protein YbcI